MRTEITRRKLAELKGQGRREYNGHFQRWIEKHLPGNHFFRILVKDLCDEHNRLICDHLWINLDHEEWLEVKHLKGKLISFTGTVSYYKGSEGQTRFNLRRVRDIKERGLK